MTKKLQSRRLTPISLKNIAKNAIAKEGFVFINKGIETNTAESFYKIVAEMAKEYRLLKRMIDKGVAEDADIKRCDELFEQISGLQCTGCGKDITLHEH